MSRMAEASGSKAMADGEGQILATAHHWSAAGLSRHEERLLPDEVPVAFTYDRATHAVMMATPRDLVDFGYGFSLTEGLIEDPAELHEIELVRRSSGMELRIVLAEPRQEALLKRRRHMAGPVGCGLCGLESLEAVLRPLPRIVGEARIMPSAVFEAVDALAAQQALHQATHAVHAAGFWSMADGLLHVREDVGRHNALDKLAGAVLRDGLDPTTGAVVLTSRVSVEMVQKAAMLGVPLLVAVSAPTELAVRCATDCGMTVVTRVRGGGFDIHSHPARIVA